MPAGPVAPVTGRPVIGIVPPPVGIVVTHEIGHFLHVAELQAEIGRIFVVGTGVARGVHASYDGIDDLQRIGVFPVFRLVGGADQQDAVGNVVGVEGGEIGVGVVSGVDQIIFVETRCRRLFLARAKRNCCECECKVA